jgi:hypothetical protein
MNLVDVLAGGLVFSLASASSLQIYGSSLRWAHGQEQRQATATAMELALAEGARTLRQHRDAATAGTGAATDSSDCSSTALLLASEIQGASVSSGITSEVRAEGEWVSVTVRATGLPERRRWLSPAAYGLCAAPTP